MVTDLGTRCDQMMDRLKQAAIEVLLEEPRSTFEVHWYNDPKLVTLRKTRQQLGRLHSNFKKLIKEIKRQDRFLRNERYRREAEMLNSLMITNPQPLRELFQ